MPLERHSLVREFPHLKENIHRLKTTDSHFERSFNEYDQVDHAVYRIESGAEAASDEHLEALKKQRLQLKDELFNMLLEEA